MPTEYRPAPTVDRAPPTDPPFPDAGWRLRQLHPGRWYAVNVRTGQTAGLPFTLSLLQAIGDFNRFRSRRAACARA